MPVITSTPITEDEKSTTNLHLPLWMFLHNLGNSVKQLVPQGGSQKSKVKSQKALILGFLAVLNGKFISADLY
ncbi:hypothetical protein JYQ62_33450 [Nostoc sp. UHCC 0702]|nr:hypothetical protein JYQ62_33450 [Nostoc sp. UHCC 0702]